MTNDQINRAISESIELFASLADSPRSDEKGANCQYDQFGHLWWYSPLWAWKHSGDYDWQPRSWRTDENASAMLLERGKFTVFYWDCGWWVARQVGATFADGVVIETLIGGAIFNSDRKTAIRSVYFAMIQKGAQ